MSEIEVTSENWQKYTRAVGDFNPIHEVEDSARYYGLEGIIAPGMYLASFALEEGDFSSVKSIRFMGMVYDGDLLKREVRDNSFVLRRGNDVVCRLNGMGVNSVSPKPLDTTLFNYKTRIEMEEIDLYVDSLGFEVGSDFPSMFLASFSAPALVEMAEKRGVTGIHASQSFYLHNGYKTGPIDVLVGDGSSTTKGGESIFSYQLRWVQDGEIIASGKSIVLPLSVVNE